MSKQYKSMKLASINRNQEAVTVPTAYNTEKANEVREFHKTIQEYSETPLVELHSLADYLGVKNILVKDESYRFGLNAFKGLGGSYAVHNIMQKQEQTQGKLTFITATDGNHGRGVAWAATRMNQNAYVYLPKGSAQERLENIQKLGAHAEITEWSYDDTVRYAARLAHENDWILVQDTSWEGYEEIPEKIMQGYLTMGAEITDQLKRMESELIPTHVFLQAGVGSMAGAMAAYFADYYQDNKPIITIVEPNGADCIYRTADANDGMLHAYQGEMHSIMAGLCCGEPCPIAWDLLKNYADYCLSCDDYIAANGMRILGNPLKGDARVISGESGASTMGAFTEIMRNPSLEDIKKELKIDSNSVVLCISTEGDTSQENYRSIVWDGTMILPS